MLQLINTPPAQSALPGEPSIAPQAQADQQAPATAQGFVEQGSVEQGFVLGAEALLVAAAPLGDTLPPAAEPAEPVDALAQLPLDPSLQQQELSAEQWLLSMLGQRLTTVQARDGEAAQGADKPQVQSMDLRSTALPTLPVQAVPDTQPAQLSAAASQTPSPAPASKNEGDSDALSALLATLAAGAEPAAASNGAVIDTSAPAVTAVAGSTPVTATTAVPQDLAAPQLERHLKLQAPEAKWGEQMLVALRDNVELQLQQKVQSATIRLDPPELGSMEVLLSHESGRLTVQISAANGDVARLLNNTSERLRQELVGQNFLQVAVQVSSDSSGQQSQQQARQRLPVEEQILAAAPLGEQEQRQQQAGSSDILVTV